MESLDEKLRQVQQRMADYESSYKENKQAVKDQLVHPILRCLGWDPEEPTHVHPNKETGEGVPDYTLLKDGQKVMIVVVKSQSANLTDALNQLLFCCTRQRIPYGLLTNGKEWRLFHAFVEETRPGNQEIWRLDVTGDADPEEKLQTIRRDRIEELGELAERRKVLESVWKELLASPPDIAEALGFAVIARCEEEYPQFRFSSEEVEAFLRVPSQRIGEVLRHEPPLPTETRRVTSRKKGSSKRRRREGRKPKWITLQGEKRETRLVRDVLVQTAEWLIEKGKLTPESCPVRWGRGKSYIVHTQRTHSDGTKFRAPHKLSNGLWLEPTVGKRTVEQIAGYLLEHCGYRPEDLKVEWSE